MATSFSLRSFKSPPDQIVQFGGSDVVVWIDAFVGPELCETKILYIQEVLCVC